MEPHLSKPDSGRKISSMDMSQLTFSSFHHEDGPENPELLGPYSVDVDGTDADELLCVQSMEFHDSHTSFVMEEGVPVPQPRGGERSNDDDASGGVSSASTSTRFSDDFSNSADRRRANRKKRQLSVGLQETLALRRIRVLLFFLTLFIVFLGAIGMFLITQQQDIKSFEQSFSSQGAMLLQHVETHLQQQLEALDTLSTDITNFVLDDTNVTWPLVTLPHSSSLLERYLHLMNAGILTICPIVPVSYREQWELYSVQAQGWIDDDLEASFLAVNHENSSQIRRRNEVNFTDIFQKLLSSPTPTISPTQSTEAPTPPLSTGVPTSSPTKAKAVPAASEYDFLDHSPEKTSSVVTPFIHDDGVELDDTTGPWAVWWQYAPVVSNRSIINYDMASSRLSHSIDVANKQMAVMSPVHSYKEPKRTDGNATVSADGFVNDLLQKQSERYNSGDPYGYIFYPVFNEIPIVSSTTSRSTVAILSATFYWKSYFEAFLPEGADGMICVVNNTLNEVFTFQIDGGNASFLGYEDLHDTSYDYLAISSNFSSVGGLSSFTNVVGYTGVPLDTAYILYSVYLFPSDAMKESYKSSTPIIVASSVVVFFALAGILFCFYDYLVSRRQRKVMDNAMKTHEIVSSLFPETVRDRIMQDAVGQDVLRPNSNASIKTSAFDASKAIADFYPSASVLFADITGFTAWCSEREPSQVFLLLESIYSEYDAIAKKRKVFKVETIGDFYMAVAGLPEPRDDHALVVCRFARECLNKLRVLLNDLEVTLGPGTVDLSMRFGIHSGPVTAGVLRSQNARFQLFGDTVNTAARMESNGAAGMVHISQEAANELTARGKSNWFYPRDEKITAKGKGELQTYWLDLAAASMDDRMSVSTGSLKTSMSHQTANDRRMVRHIDGRPVALAVVQACRLVDWIVDTLSPMLSRILVQRKIRIGQQDLSAGTTHSVFQSFSPNIVDDVLSMEPPVFVPLAPDACLTNESLSSNVKEQLHDYVHLIASLYNNNQDRAYHSLEHAAHVIMSVAKFLHRMIPSSPDESIAPELQALFFDPVTPFSCILAALVHDIEYHSTTRVGTAASNEQNSLQLAWSLLIQRNFSVLRQAIWGGEDTELRRFQYLWVHMVLATEVERHDMVLRRQPSKIKKDSVSQRHLSAPRLPPAHGAMKLLEYVMQASDISHRMQHWHTYRKWTERLWHESASRGKEKLFFDQELQYMDEYVLPLTEELRDTWDAVRGRQHSMEDIHQAAMKLRDEWKELGPSIVAELSGTTRMSV